MRFTLIILSIFCCTLAFAQKDNTQREKIEKGEFKDITGGRKSKTGLFWGISWGTNFSSLNASFSEPFFDFSPDVSATIQTKTPTSFKGKMHFSYFATPTIGATLGLEYNQYRHQIGIEELLVDRRGIHTIDKDNAFRSINIVGLKETLVSDRLNLALSMAFKKDLNPNFGVLGNVGLKGSFFTLSDQINVSMDELNTLINYDSDALGVIIINNSETDVTASIQSINPLNPAETEFLEKYNLSNAANWETEFLATPLVISLFLEGGFYYNIGKATQLKANFFYDLGLNQLSNPNLDNTVLDQIQQGELVNIKQSGAGSIDYDLTYYPLHTATPINIRSFGIEVGIVFKLGL